VKCLDFFIGKDEVQLRDKILRFRSIALDSIPADLRKRVSHSPGNTIVPLDVNSLGQHGCRPGQRISVFGATYVQVTQPKPPPDNDVSLLPFILHIDGVRYQREIRKP
jgi:hypothetical protein